MMTVSFRSLSNSLFITDPTVLPYKICYSIIKMTTNTQLQKQTALLLETYWYCSSFYI